MMGSLELAELLLTFGEFGSNPGSNYNNAVKAASAVLAALSVQPVAAVVGEPVAAYHVKVKGYGEELCFTEDGANSLVKRIRRTNGQHGVATITPLYATLPNEALEQSEQATFDIAARLLKERDALASRISQQDAELERMRSALRDVCTAIEREPIVGDLDYPHAHNGWRGWRKKVLRPATEKARAALAGESQT